MMHKERGCKYDTLTFKGRLLGIQIVLYNTSLKTSTIFHTLLVSSLFLRVPQPIYVTTRQCLCENFNDKIKIKSTNLL